MKNKILCCVLLLLPSLVARAGLYVEPRFSYLHVAGTPNVGDLGVKQSSTIEHLAPEISVGYSLGSRVSVELRYTWLGDVEVLKTWPYLHIFPTPGPLIPTLRQYRYVQETSVATLALPIKVIAARNLTFFVTPLVQRADASIEFVDSSPAVDFFPGYRYRQHDTPIHGGGELSIAYALGTRGAVTLHYTYLPLPGFDAHLVGAGLNFRF